MSSRAIEWHVDAASSRSLRVMVYLAVGLFGGGALLLLGGMGFLGVSLALDGEYTYLAWVALLAFIGGPLSLVYLWPMLVEREQRPPLASFAGDREMAERYAAVFTRDRLLAAVLCGAVGLFALALVDPRLAFGAVVGSFLLLPVASGVISRGRVDPNEATLTYMDRPVDLARIERIRRVDLGGTAFCWLSYHPGYGSFGTPHLIVAVPEAADAIERTVASVEPEIDEEYDPNRVVQAALGALALSSFSTAVFVFFAEPGSAGDPVLRWYIAVVFCFFGLLFALVAFFSG
ncbi:hypothetical protein [Halalkalicoccus tibetensis]|uniref:PH domain-containing protein n=1 Tax=Halalkalicoccus tibetensis TaxID=175632 RepID=A0ABD5UXK3_9EURY